MKSKKVFRITSLILALCIALPIVNFGFAAAQEQPSIQNYAYDALKAIDFITEDFAAFKDNDYVSRAVYTGNLFKLSGIDEVSADNYYNPFTDVNEHTPYRTAIVSLFDMGYINGTGSDTFSPDEFVTYGQVVKMALNVLGYKQYVDARYGGTIEGYVIVADRLKINENIRVYNTNENVTACDMTQLLYNIGKTPVYEVSAIRLDKDGYIQSYDKGEILLSGNDIYYNEGIVQCNGIVNIDGTEADVNCAVIGGIKYTVQGFDISEYLGCEVEYFYKKTDSTPALMWAYPIDTTNMLEIDCDDLLVDDKNYSRTNIVYEVGDKAKKAKIDKYAQIVYNNQLHNEYTGQQLKIKSGSIKLVDNNNDDVYDLVIVKEFKNIFVTTVADNLSFVTDKFGKSIYFEDYENVKIIHNGKFITVSEIPLNVVVSCIESSDKKHLYMYVGESVKRGTLDKFEADGENSVYYFGENGYKLANSYITVSENYNTITPVAGSQYKYYLDISGKIAYIEDMETNMKYSYLIKCAPDSDNFAKQGKAMFRILLADGTQVDVKSADKLVLNGHSNSTGTDVVNYIENSGIELPAVVQAQFNGNSDLKEIQFAEPTDNPYGYDSTKFSLDYEILNAEFGSDTTYMINKKYTVTANTVCFATNRVSGEEDTYEIIKLADIWNTTYDIKLYDCDSSLEPAVVSLVRSPSTRVIESIFVVDKVTRVLVDGVAVKQIEGVAKGLNVKYAEYAPGCIPDNLKKGDIVRLSAYNNLINKVTVLARPSTSKEPFVTDFGKKTCYIFGQLYSRGVNNIVTVNPPNDPNGLITGTTIRSTSSTRVTVYDHKNKQVYAGHINDLYQINQPDANGDLPELENNVYCFIQRRYNYVEEIVVVYY